MKFIYLTLIISLFFEIESFSQKNYEADYHKINSPISKRDSVKFSRIPQLKLPISYKNKDLPAIVDNSELIYFRPVFEQVQNECEQASGVAMNFTYEIDFLRNLSADIEENQYPTHYCWNFGNGGNGWYGVSYLHSFEILKMNGTPNVIDYGGMSAGGPQRWLSGYQEYYNGMFNRINDYYAIKVGTPEGLLILKHWLNDHLNGSGQGGVASVNTDSGWGTILLAEGTPEEGKHAVVAWSSAVGHGLTICGYNDSIRYDYNGDGLYTNDIDINDDEIVDMKDWEIGGLKFANNYWPGPVYADSGFCYMMYKTLADDFGNGGLWNNEVHVVKPKEEYSPLLTVRAIVKHNSRDMIKVLVGISSDTNDIEPYTILDFPIFDFQGDNQYMQGGNLIEENKTIEFGLDISPLLNEINSGQIAKVFFQIIENDPENIGSGEIVHFSIIDYTNGTNEINCNNSNVTITNNSTTTLSLTHLFDFYEVNIETEELPAATLYQLYEFQINASGGTAPYSWDILKKYIETNYAENFIEFNDEQLEPNNLEDGFVIKELDFDFPFYGETFNEVYISTDGFIYFGQNLYPWPYIYGELIYFKNLNLISPFLCLDLEINNSYGNGIWYQGDENSASFRWNASFIDLSGDEFQINASTRIFPSGEIELLYGDNSVPENQSWISGISNGDLQNYQQSSISNLQNPQTNQLIKFAPPQFIHKMDITDDGVLQGTPQNVYESGEISVQVVDNNNISTFKTFEFNTEGVIMEYTVEAEGNEIIEASENVKLSFTIQNTNSQVLNNISFNLNCSDPYITLVDSIFYIGQLNPGETIILNDVFEFNVANNTPNNYPANLVAGIHATEGIWERNINALCYSAILKVNNHFISDGNNYSLSSNETADFILEVKNNGMAKANDVEVIIEANDPYIIINSNSAILDLLSVDSSWMASFNISAVENVPFEYIADINYNITIGNGFPTSGAVPLKINFNVEDFESNSTDLFPWINTSSNAWLIDNETALGGDYSLRSANIEDSQESTIFIFLEVLEEGKIGFHKKISCEDSPSDNADYLKFIINTTEVERWDGQIDWSYECFEVEAGINMFKWTYKKNQDVSANNDCVWLDNISFPKLGNIIGFGFESSIDEERDLLLTYPNPFNDLVDFNFVVTEPGNFHLEIFNLNGKKIKSLLSNKYLEKGNYSFMWNGDNDAGIAMPDGIYYCVVQMNDFIVTRKLIKLKQ